MLSHSLQRQDHGLLEVWMCKRELCRVGKVDKKTHREGTKKWEQQRCEVLLVASEAQVVWMRMLQRSATQFQVNLQSRHHKSAETTHAAK